MRGFILRLIVNAIALGVTAAVLPGIHVQDNSVATLLIVAFIFGIVNAILKPILTILSCSLIIFTLGLFMLVINGLMLLITDAIAGSYFTVDGLGWAILGGIVMGFVGMLLESVLDLDEDKKDKDEKVVIYRD